VTLTFDLLISNLVRVSARVVGNFRTNFGVSGTFHYGPTPARRTTWPCDLDLWSWRSPRLWVILFFVLHLYTKLEVQRLSVRKVWRTSGLSISRPGALDIWLWPWNSCALWPSNLPTNFGVSMSFYSRLIGQRLSDSSGDLATLTTFDFGGRGACRWQGSSWSICLPRLKFRRYDALPVLVLVDLVTLTFDVWHWGWCTLLRLGWATFLPIFVFLRRFNLFLLVNACQTHHVTLRPWPLTSEVMALVLDMGLYAPSLHQVSTS